jgi:hypothetical protein
MILNRTELAPLTTAISLYFHLELSKLRDKNGCS